MTQINCVSRLGNLEEEGEEVSTVPRLKAHLSPIIHLFSCVRNDRTRKLYGSLVSCSKSCRRSSKLIFPCMCAGNTHNTTRPLPLCAEDKHAPKLLATQRCRSQTFLPRRPKFMQQVSPTWSGYRAKCAHQWRCESICRYFLTEPSRHFRPNFHQE